MIAHSSPPYLAGRSSVLIVSTYRLHDRNENFVTGQVAVGTVNFFEVIDIEKQQRKGHPVAPGKRKASDYFLRKAPSVECIGKAVTGGRFVHLLMVALLQFVLKRIFEYRASTQNDLFSVPELRSRHLFSLNACSVGAFKIPNQDITQTRERHCCVKSGDADIPQDQIALAEIL